MKIKEKLVNLKQQVSDNKAIIITGCVVGAIVCLKMKEANRELEDRLYIQEWISRESGVEDLAVSNCKSKLKKAKTII